MAQMSPKNEIFITTQKGKGRIDAYLPSTKAYGNYPFILVKPIDVFFSCYKGIEAKPRFIHNDLQARIWQR